MGENDGKLVKIALFAPKLDFRRRRAPKVLRKTYSYDHLGQGRRRGGHVGDIRSFLQKYVKLLKVLALSNILGFWEKYRNSILCRKTFPKSDVQKPLRTDGQVQPRRNGSG